MPVTSRASASPVSDIQPPTAQPLHDVRLDTARFDARASPAGFHETCRATHDDSCTGSCRRVCKHFVHVDAVGWIACREERGAAHQLRVAVQLLLQLWRVSAL
jgi:hypothetical protein